MKEYLESNKLLWNTKTPLHAKSEFYNIDAFKNGASSLNPVEIDALGDISEKKILHLQCHFGMDTLSLARMGAHCTGIDFSNEAIFLARSLSKELNIDARFIESDVYTLPEVLNESFDIVFTSYGVICWLPDLLKWANVVDHFLQPGGTFYIVEHHPVLMMLDFDKLTFDFPYFNSGSPFMEEVTETYAGSNTHQKMKEYFWNHSLEEVIQPFLHKGYHLNLFREYNYTPYDCFPDMKAIGKGKYAVKTQAEIPHLFEMKATKS